MAEPRIRTLSQNDYSALSERVVSHERSLSEFKDATTASLSEISRQIQHLANHMDSRLRPQWGVLLSALGAVMYVLIYFVIQPMQHDSERLASTISEIQRETIKSLHDLRLDTVPRSTFDTHALAQARYEERLEDRLHALELRVLNQQAPR